MLGNNELWNSVLEDVRGEISEANFSTWFKDTFIVKQDEGVVTISVPNQFVRDWVRDKFHSMILRVMREKQDSVRSIEYVISKNRPDPNKNMNDIPSPMVSGELPFQDLYINSEDNLNPRYTFDTFVVGSFNELAYAAAQAIITNSGRVYNPFFIYGKTGCGKTHLIQSVGNAIKEADENMKIFYVTSEKFAQDLVSSLQQNKINSFKEKYRKYDVFIMDDIQFLSGKEKTQEELFHLFNTLYNANKQIIFSSDQHPNYIPKLEERLQSRFAAGMIVDITPPDHESRIAIVKAKAQMHNFLIDDEIAEYVASVIDGNVRELEGSLNTIICQSQLKNRSLSLNEVKSVLKNNIKPKNIISTEEVVRIIANYFNLDEENIYKKTRKKEVVRPRQLIMYLLREDFGMAYPAIGQKLGGRDHTTVIHSYEKIKNDLQSDAVLVQEVEQLRGLL